jgi:predicted DNA-binding transcriptional regulator AlpA
MSEIIIMTITKTEIHQLVESAVLKALNQKSSNQKSDQDSFLGVDEAASFLGIAKATLYGKCSKLMVPHFKQGKKLYLFTSFDPGRREAEFREILIHALFVSTRVERIYG